jgi:hypothetical protein
MMNKRRPDEHHRSYLRWHLRRKSSVLVNAHLDSTLPSPGAADDGVMMEYMGVLVGVPGWEPKRAIVFCEFPACVLG